MRDSLRQLTLTRFREFIREPEAIFWSLAFPILLSIGLGIAFRNRPPEVVRVGVVGEQMNRRFVYGMLLRSKAVVAETLSVDSARAAFRAGRIVLIVEARQVGRVDYHFDETRPEARTARLIVNEALQDGAGRYNPFTAFDHTIRERGSRYIDFVVPGLLGMGLMGNGIWGIGFAIVDARRKRLLKRLMATPMSRVEYLGSFVLSGFASLVVQVLALVLFAALVFKVPLRGSLWQLGLIFALGGMVFGALGLLIAARPRTIEGASGLMNLTMMPMWIFSGVFFSAENFPRVIQPAIQALPLTAVNDALRANMLRGASFAEIAPELAVIGVWTVVCFVLALRLFRWR